MIEHLLDEFKKIYPTDDLIRVFFAPGRVNLIGEHTDYNGGHVFPCALSLGTYALVSPRNDRQVRMISKNFRDLGVISFDLDHITYQKKHDWVNYPKGVIKVFQQHNYDIKFGFDVLYYGNIPHGAGLSSSASIELATAVMVNTLFELQIPMVNLVKMSQEAENTFVGVSCGIMDQFAIGMGKKDHAILLNSESLEYAYSPIQFKNEVLIITNSNKRRVLADSKYNERRSECEQALKELQVELDIKTLGDLSIDLFEACKHLIQSELHRKRAKHAVYENHRTQKAVLKLEQGDIQALGKLMNESHISLRDEYEVTGKELDTLVEASWKADGVIGSRMTGAGFGGCTISIVEKEKVTAFKTQVGTKYQEDTGLVANFYEVEIGNGASELVLHQAD